MEPKIKTGKRMKTGEIMIQHGLINYNQLKEAMKIQSQSGGHVGEILVELGYLPIDRLLEFLGKQFGVPSANLYKLSIEPSVINMLPFNKMKDYRALPIAVGEKSVTIAMVNPHNFAAIKDLEFILGRSIQPVVVLSSQITSALKIIEDKGGRLKEQLSGIELEIAGVKRRVDVDMIDIKFLFRKIVEENASDLLLTAGVPPCLKKDNEVIRLSFRSLKPEQVEMFANELMSVEQREEFNRTKEMDFASTFPEIGRFRINIYKQRGSISIAVRPVVEIIPNIKELGLPSWIEEFALKTKGLILITGPVGHGKTTTLAAMVDIINTKRKCNIITIEDPIEYLHKHKASNVNQREVGLDTDSFNEGLRHIFRQAPDVMVIGEMRDMESFAIALQAADTGHLVLSTLHSHTSTSSIERIIDIFPPYQQQQIRVQLAENFLLILNQRLVSSKKGEGRILAYERLVNSYRVKNLIREAKTHQIRSMLQQSTDDFITIDQSLAKLCLEGKIT
ncbi:MAG: PilT/PilU family type 4a pilus ATPase, partial [Nitrospirota bacterium]|nr:PilT/PilU family type 4a pilus ATPase [Nitrospirota bacterium]